MPETDFVIELPFFDMDIDAACIILRIKFKKVCGNWSNPGFRLKNFENKNTEAKNKNFFKENSSKIRTFLKIILDKINFY